MANVSIDKVEPNMEVLADVVDARGNVLMKKGSSLSDVWIERLKKRGVKELSVMTEEQAAESNQASEEAYKARIADLQVEMKVIFAPVLGQPHMKALAKATYQFLMIKNK